MSPEVFAWSPEAACDGLRRLGPWDWLITCDRRIDEARARWCRDCLPHHTPHIEVRRAMPDKPHRFDVAFGQGSEDNDLDWSQLGGRLAEEIQPGQRVLVDMDLLAFDVLLYLLPALREIGLAALGCVYIAPVDYTFSGTDLSDQLLLPIEQPKAYVALALDADRKQARHLVFLNFDLARAWKFIDRYDWKYDHIYVGVSEPAFVPDGRARAMTAAEPWINVFLREQPEHVQNLPAHDPASVAEWCQGHWNVSKWLDIVPIGPKPMNLGILWFYFGLPERDRGRVRLLYDFPVQQAPRSRGIREIYFYDCARLLR